MHGKMDCFGRTHIGLVRESNQDQYLIADLKKSVIIHHASLSYDDETELLGGSQAKLLLVADGLGGHAGGDRASMLALESVVQYLLNAMHWIFLPEDDREETFLEDLKAAMEFTQSRIQHAAETTPDHEGMGTTITMAYIVWPHAYIVHAGDSRAYLFRDQQLIRLTRDQTYAQALADSGALTPEQIDKSPLNHILFSLLGCKREQLDPQVLKTTLKWNDTLLLCTDGLTRHLTDDDITAVLKLNEPAEAVTDRMVHQANDAGGRDNVTVVVARFGDPPRSEAEVARQAAVETQDTVTV